MDATLKRLAPLTGVVFVVLYVIATAVGGDGAPDFAGPADEVVAYYSDSTDQILFGAVVGAISTPFFLWFAGCLRSAIARVEGGTTRLASTAFGSAVAALSLGVAGTMVNAMAALRVDEQGEISPDAAATYFDIGQILSFAAVPAAIAAALAATAVASLRYKAILPAWLAYGSLALAVVDVIPPISWAGTLVGLVWVLVVSVLLYTQRVTEEPVATARPGAI